MKKRSKKKNFKKSDKSFKGLDRRFHYSYNRDLVDYDYVDKLSDEDKKWLSDFSDNYYGGRIKRNPDDNVIKSKAEFQEIWRDRERRRYDTMVYKDKMIDKGENELNDFIMEKALIQKHISKLQEINPNSEERKQYADAEAYFSRAVRKARIQRVSDTDE